ncbi:hypothetical protein DSECCO2_527560 [anaerobic digester metagenome]
MLCLSQVLPWNVDRKTFGDTNLVQLFHGDLRINDVAVRCGQHRCAFAQSFGRITDEKLRINMVFNAQALTFGALSCRAVERKQTAVGFCNAVAVSISCKLQSQQIPQPGDGADCRARTGCVALLIEHQHGRQSFNLIGFGPAEFNILMIAARKKMFVKQPPAFFSDNVVYKRRLAAAAHTTYHNQLPVRDFEADVF